MRKLVIAAVALIAVAAGSYWYYMTYEPSRMRFPVQGIDVSHHQGAIDWQQAAGDGVDFAYIKATEGGDFTDPSFAENWQGARAAGIPVGAYHFYSFCRDPKEQAAHFVATVPREAGTLPPAVDVEFEGNCDEEPGRDDFVIGMLAFLEVVDAHFGAKTVIYASRDSYKKLVGGRFLDRPFWFRSVVSAPVLNERMWTFWQYHDRGSRAGIDGNVDLDAFAGTEEEFRELLLKPAE